MKWFRSRKRSSSVIVLPDNGGVVVAKPELKEHKYRVVTTAKGTYLVEYSTDGIEWKSLIYYDFAGEWVVDRKYDYPTLSEAIDKVDELVAQQAKDILNASLVGRVMYGPKP